MTQVGVIPVTPWLDHVVLLGMDEVVIRLAHEIEHILECPEGDSVNAFFTRKKAAFEGGHPFTMAELTREDWIQLLNDGQAYITPFTSTPPLIIEG